MKKKILLIGGSGFIGRAIAGALENSYKIVPTAAHNTPENGYCLTVEEPGKLMEILIRENPEIVISSVRGNYQAQMIFHKKLADWLAGKKKRLLYLSTANVFDGGLSRPWMEEDLPVPESDYGIFKRDCEAMLGRLLGSQLTILRPAAVWDCGCPRIRQLERHGYSGEPYLTYPGYMINVTLARQIGEYAKYILKQNLHGIFHIGTTDTVDYFSFERMVCEALGIKMPEFVTETADPAVFLAALPSRKEIPGHLQMTVSEVLSALER